MSPKICNVTEYCHGRGSIPSRFLCLLSRFKIANIPSHCCDWDLDQHPDPPNADTFRVQIWIDQKVTIKTIQLWDSCYRQNLSTHNNFKNSGADQSFSFFDGSTAMYEETFQIFQPVSERQKRPTQKKWSASKIFESESERCNQHQRYRKWKWEV